MLTGKPLLSSATLYGAKYGLIGIQRNPAGPQSNGSLSFRRLRGKACGSTLTSIAGNWTMGSWMTLAEERNTFETVVLVL